MGFGELASKAGSRGTICIFYNAVMISMLNGAALPAIFLLFRFLIDSFGESAASEDSLQRNDEAFEFATAQGLSEEELLAKFEEETGDSNPLEQVRSIAIIQIYIACGIFVIATIAAMQFNYFAEALSRKIRVDYFRSCLAKDAAFYDTQSPTELPSKIAAETEKIKSGMGDKIEQAVKAIGTCVVGFIVAFILEWRLALLLITFSPVFVLIGVTIRVLVFDSLNEVQKAYS